MEWLSWIIVGAIAGWLAGLLVKGDEGLGVIGHVLLGLVGALLGGYVVSLLTNNDPMDGVFDISTLVTAVIGAVVLVLLGSMVMRGRRTGPARSKQSARPSSSEERFEGLRKPRRRVPRPSPSYIGRRDAAASVCSPHGPSRRLNTNRPTPGIRPRQGEYARRRSQRPGSRLLGRRCRDAGRHAREERRRNPCRSYHRVGPHLLDSFPQVRHVTVAHGHLHCPIDRMRHRRSAQRGSGFGPVAVTSRWGTQSST